jgi:hypothetical protein
MQQGRSPLSRSPTHSCSLCTAAKLKSGRHFPQEQLDGQLTWPRCCFRRDMRKVFLGCTPNSWLFTPNFTKVGERLRKLEELGFIIIVINGYVVIIYQKKLESLHRSDRCAVCNSCSFFLENFEWLHKLE